MFSVGDRVGDYEIVAKLKAGGMATLFLGRRLGVEGFSRHVAIKVVHEHLASDPSFVRMFVDEALLSAKIQHPNVVHVEELGELSGRHYLVMEYVHGCALSSLLNALYRQRRTVSPDIATYVAVNVAAGLHAAHEATGSDGQPLGVVHRDVSPQNVLLAYRGHVKLIDFGVAKAAGRAQQTTGASLKGKIGYMSPEQAFGRPVDRRTDIYALGVVLWEMLTGRKAFHADNDFALLELVRDPKLPPASAINPAVPPALDAVIAKATAREASQRFDTAQQMRKALAQAMPSALAHDASDLERLLGAALGSEIQEEQRVLPESLTGIAPTAAVAAEPDEIVRTMTVSISGLEPPRAQPITSPSGTMILPESSQSAPIAAPPERSRTALYVVLGILITIVLGVGAGVVVIMTKSEAPEMRATELPRDEIEETSVAAPPPEPAPAVEPAPAPTEPAARPAPEPVVEQPPAEPSVQEDDRPRQRRRRPPRERSGGGVPMMDEF